MSEYTNLLIENDNGIALVTLNRPKALNALNAAMMHELERLFGELANDPRCR